MLAHEADRLAGGPGACLVIDDAALPKKGALSVGVARQCCGQLGKRANCQSLVSLTLAQGEVPVPVGLRLFLPDEWTGAAERRVRAGVPEAAMAPRSKGEIALAAGVWFGVVLADAGWTNEACAGPWASRATGRCKGRMCASSRPAGANAALCRTKSGVPPRRSSPGCGGGPRRGGAAPSGRSPPASRRPGCAWAMARRSRTTATCPARKRGWRASGERKFHLSNLPPSTSLRALAAVIKARWVCEQAHQQLNQELGLGHFEGRSRTGLHRHALMACNAFAHLQHLRVEPRGIARTARWRSPLDLAEHHRTEPGKNAATRPGTTARCVVTTRLFAHIAHPVRCPHCKQQFQPSPDQKRPR